MNTSKAGQLSIETLSFLLMILSGPLLANQSTTEDPSNYPDSWYRLVLDASGRSTSGDGHGYGAGTWYYYPDTGWYRQWFYNQPFDTADKGRLQYVVYVRAVDATRPTTFEINVNWTTPQWSQLNAKQPPLPQDGQLEDVVAGFREFALQIHQTNYVDHCNGPAGIEVDELGGIHGVIFLLLAIT